MVGLSPRAEDDLETLVDHYIAIGRPEVARTLFLAVDRVKARIERAPDSGLSAPRPYPKVRAAGVKWMLEARYWFAYSIGEPRAIIGIFYAAADIPNRF